MHRSIQTILNRRKVIAGAVAAPAIAAAVPVAATAAPFPDPVWPLIEAWKEAVSCAEELGRMNADDNAMNCANDVVNGIADKLAVTAPTTPEGLARYLDFVRQQYNTQDHSGWADDIDLKAADTAVAASFAIAGIDPPRRQPRQDLTDADVADLLDEIHAASGSESLRLIDELGKTNAPAVIQRALNSALAAGVPA